MWKCISPVPLNNEYLSQTTIYSDIIFFSVFTSNFPGHQYQYVLWSSSNSLWRNRKTKNSCLPYLPQLRFDRQVPFYWNSMLKTQSNQLYAVDFSVLYTHTQIQQSTQNTYRLENFSIEKRLYSLEFSKPNQFIRYPIINYSHSGYIIKLNGKNCPVHDCVNVNVFPPNKNQVI